MQSNTLSGRLAALVLAAIAIAGCDQMSSKRTARTLERAEEKYAAGEFQEAIALYESALDPTAASAETHFRIALIYDDKLKEPLHALHHFKRYLQLSPKGKRVAEVQKYIKRDELALATGLNPAGMLPRDESVKLKNENLKLIGELRDEKEKVLAMQRQVAERNNGKPPRPAEVPNKGNKKYTVKPGDTLFSISRAFFKTDTRWKEIADANRIDLKGETKLKPGQELSIPAK